MSRLQVGGLALTLTTGSIVTLVKFIGDCSDRESGAKFNSVWHVQDSRFQVLYDDSLNNEYGVEAKYLIPLGDDKGIELYSLREEIMTRHDKEAV